MVFRHDSWDKRTFLGAQNPPLPRAREHSPSLGMKLKITRVIVIHQSTTTIQSINQPQFNAVIIEEEKQNH
jgi:hypothetical protein